MEDVYLSVTLKLVVSLLVVNVSGRKYLQFHTKSKQAIYMPIIYVSIQFMV